MAGENPRNEIQELVAALTRHPETKQKPLPPISAGILKQIRDVTQGNPLEQ